MAITVSGANNVGGMYHAELTGTSYVPSYILLGLLKKLQSFKEHFTQNK